VLFRSLVSIAPAGFDARRRTPLYALSVRCAACGHVTSYARFQRRDPGTCKVHCRACNRKSDLDALSFEHLRREFHEGFLAWLAARPRGAARGHEILGEFLPHLCRTRGWSPNDVLGSFNSARDALLGAGCLEHVASPGGNTLRLTDAGRARLGSPGPEISAKLCPSPAV
jgi:hypothetical protein